jgi:hypothetical protein
VVDLADLADPTLVATSATAGFARAVAASGSLVVVGSPKCQSVGPGVRRAKLGEGGRDDMR